MTKQKVLKNSNFGHRVAEDEVDALASYFVETDNWQRLVSGEIDVVYGPKGSGKSALYTLLVARSDMLFDQDILLVPGEKPRGTPAFRDIVVDPPASEVEFVNLWKLYFLSLLSATFEEYGIENREATHIRERLAEEGLIKGLSSLRALVHSAFNYVKRLLRPEAVEGTVSVDPNTQLPNGFTGKIIFAEPTAAAREEGVESIDHLMDMANTALRKYAKYNVWILLDRLDVAFAESPELEQNALRALFRVYLDLLDFEHIRLKIFLRSDIWNRITSEGFREASHITRHVTVNWDRSSLLNLIVRRALHNDELRGFYGTNLDNVLESTQSQEAFFFRICPDQVDVGPNKPSTLDWILSRTRDGTQLNAPRELIHLLGSLRTQQLRRFELGEPPPDGEALFARPSFKQALPEVSEVRLTQTLYAEHPDLRTPIEALREQRTLQRLDTLAALWKIDEASARGLASRLVEVGFFEQRGTREAPEYWVPFLYRDSLRLIQGAAD
ncbi:P-loop ATPase, Sll1717 family [Thiosocius teredinicola]|uniref:P-loop ATPase, Sll1717 family n=1 Tax=Thiosocius teredinicola TaxID=1973002 RepID=UPI000990CD10